VNEIKRQKGNVHRKREKKESQTERKTKRNYIHKERREGIIDRKTDKKEAILERSKGNN
jgi:hypothetical protein